MSNITLSQEVVDISKKMQYFYNLTPEETFEYAKKLSKFNKEELGKIYQDFLDILKDDFFTFLKNTYPLVHDGDSLKKHPNTAVLCHNLQAAAFGDFEGNIYNMFIGNLSRGTGKSLISTVWFLCWLVFRDPSVKILVTSMSSKLNLEWHNSRMLILETMQKYGMIDVSLKANISGQPYVTITDNKTGKVGKIDTTTIYSTTLGGTYDVIIADDPETFAAKFSDAQQEASKQHFSAIFPTLRTPSIDESNKMYFEQITENQARKIKVEKFIKKNKELQKVNRLFILIQQRLYVGDVTDRILSIAYDLKEKANQNYLHLMMPAWWENDIEYRSPLTGEVIFSATMEKNGKNGKIYNQMGALSESFTEAISAQIGIDETLAQLQQTPVEGSSQCFSYNSILDWKPEDLIDRISGKSGSKLKVRRMCVMTDFAFTAKSTSDYTVMIAYLECEEEVNIIGEIKTVPCIYILDMYRSRTDDLNTLGKNDLYTFIECWSQNDYYMNLCEKKSLTLFMTREAGHMTMINEFQRKLRGNNKYVFEVIDRRGIQKEVRILNLNLIERINYGGLHVPHKDYEDIITRCTQALTTKKDKKLRYVDIAHQVKNEFKNFRQDGSHRKTSHDDIIDCVADMFVEAYKPKKLPFVEFVMRCNAERLAKMQAK